MRRALVVGIDDYAHAPLNGCVRDAISMSETLNTNGDGSPNFDVRTLSSNDHLVTSDALEEAVVELFASEAEIALFYFSGHGHLKETGGTLVTQDSNPGIRGLTMAELIQKANGAHSKIRSTIIILDCCHAGSAGESPNMLADEVSAVGKGVIVLSASHKDGYALETDGKGVFTSILVEGLRGSASDILGNVTPASIYSLVDQTLGSWDQRPLFKANVQAFVSLRKVSPRIPLDTLRSLTDWFPNENAHFQLDPQFEPDRQNVPEEFRDMAVDREKERTFKQLQLCNRHGLIVPVDADHMYYAAINSTSCRLTALGAHYRKLAELERI